jgi:hypothetical protein
MGTRQKQIRNKISPGYTNTHQLICLCRTHTKLAKPRFRNGADTRRLLEGRSNLNIRGITNPHHPMTWYSLRQAKSLLQFLHVQDVAGVIKLFHDEHLHPHGISGFEVIDVHKFCRLLAAVVQIIFLAGPQFLSPRFECSEPAGQGWRGSVVRTGGPKRVSPHLLTGRLETASTRHSAGLVAVQIY